MRYPKEGVLPVIHLNSKDQAVEAAGLAKESGAQGVFVASSVETSPYSGVFKQAELRALIECDTEALGVNL